MKERRFGHWGTRLGFYLAAVASAFGLGNVWRFPYVVSENGGGAFVLLFLLLLVSIGIPMMIGEILFGRITGRSLVGAFDKAQMGSLTEMSEKSKKIFRLSGVFATGICIVVLSYYAVVSGWVLHYLTQYLVSTLGMKSFSPTGLFFALKENGPLQVGLTSVHLIVCSFVVARGVQQGVERWLGIVMPAFFVVLLVLAYQSLSMPTAKEALRFLFYPDFSKLTVASLAHAIGHMCFTLSIGFGMMVTFGSYIRGNSYIPAMGFRVATLDWVLSLLVGIIIFPIVLVTSFQGSGPDLLFQTVPSFLETSSGGHLLGFGFFVCLYLAALGASLGLLEGIVANVLERFPKTNRVKASQRVGAVCLLLAIFPALSTTFLSQWTVAGKGLLEFTDRVLIDLLLPLSALIVSQIVIHKVNRKKLEEEFLFEETPTAKKMFHHWIFVLKWIVPIVVGTGIFLQLFEFFKMLAV